MTSQHTPGPWRVCPQGRLTPGATVPIQSAPDAEGFRLTICHTRTTGPEGAADARLIAEAPSTLAALEQLLDAMEPPRSRKASEAWDAAHAAVRRARTATD